MSETGSSRSAAGLSGLVSPWICSQVECYEVLNDELSVLCAADMAGLLDVI
jgi:hypothetical protein